MVLRTDRDLTHGESDRRWSCTRYRALTFEGRLMTMVKLPRRKFLRLAAGAATLPALPQIARTQAYPSRPITIIAPFPAGGGSDAIGRIIAERMRATLGPPVIIENVVARMAALAAVGSPALRPMATPSSSPTGTHMSRTAPCTSCNTT
jgi:hypothetical protein